MKLHPLLKSGVLIAGGLFLVSGCVYPDRERYRREEERREEQNQAATGEIVGQETVVPTLPPAPVAEVATPSPGPDFIWIAGGWSWHDQWMWEPGHWAQPPSWHAVWVPHRCENRNGVIVFIQGGWKIRD
jgi:hypothetical protein